MYLVHVFHIHNLYPPAYIHVHIRMPKAIRIYIGAECKHAYMQWKHIQCVCAHIYWWNIGSCMQQHYIHWELKGINGKRNLNHGNTVKTCQPLHSPSSLLVLDGLCTFPAGCQPQRRPGLKVQILPQLFLIGYHHSAATAVLVRQRCHLRDS